MKKTILSIIAFFCLGFSLILNFINPINVYANTSSEYTAKALFLMDYNTNQVLYENNSLNKMPVASIVKLMTICLTCQELDSGNLQLDNIVIASDKAASMGGSQVFIEAGGEYSVGDLLKSTIVSSANDASVALAEEIAGSEENFVLLMNKKAKELGMQNTNYVNCTGLPASNQFSCAKDTAILLKEVIKYKDYHKFSTIWIDNLKHNKGRETELVNTNKLIRYYEGCDGGKTGSTNEAGYCLAATAKRGNMRLIGIVLGAENGKLRFAETSKLLNYGFNNYENKLIVNKEECLNEEVSITNANQNYVKIKPYEDLFVLVNKTENLDNFEIKTKINKNIKAPIKSGEKVGEIYVVKNGEVVAFTNLVCVNNVNKSSIYDGIIKTINNWKIK